MKRLITTCALALALSSACGGGQEASPPAPTGTAEITGRIMGPADKARDTVNQLNDLQEREQNSPGS